MLTVTTQDGAIYSLALRDSGSHGRVLAISRSGGVDAAPIANKPMEQDRWYHVNVIDPLPPQIGTQLSMVLDPVLDDPDPLVRQTGMVTSVVGLLQSRTPMAPMPDERESTVLPLVVQPMVTLPVDELAPHPATDTVAAQSEFAFFNGERKFAKTAGLFGAVLGLASLLSRRR